MPYKYNYDTVEDVLYIYTYTYIYIGSYEAIQKQTNRTLGTLSER